jgi:hypothetical protein
MDSVDIRLWHLLQAGGLDGEKTVSPNELLVLGTVVFGLLVVGLVLTILEFRKMN